MAGQCCTSSNVRPQPLHRSSPWLVEQMAMQGVSGVVSYQPSQASRASSGRQASSTVSSWRYTISAYTSASACTCGARAMPALEGKRWRQWLMAASMSVMWMAVMKIGVQRKKPWAGRRWRGLDDSDPRSPNSSAGVSANLLVNPDTPSGHTQYPQPPRPCTGRLTVFQSPPSKGSSSRPGHARATQHAQQHPGSVPSSVRSVSLPAVRVSAATVATPTEQDL